MWNSSLSIACNDKKWSHYYKNNSGKKALLFAFKFRWSQFIVISIRSSHYGLPLISFSIYHNFKEWKKKIIKEWQTLDAYKPRKYDNIQQSIYFNFNRFSLSLAPSSAHVRMYDVHFSECSRTKRQLIAKIGIGILFSHYYFAMLFGRKISNSIWMPSQKYLQPNKYPAVIFVLPRRYFFSAFLSATTAYTKPNEKKKNKIKYKISRNSIIKNGCRLNDFWEIHFCVYECMCLFFALSLSQEYVPLWHQDFKLKMHTSDFA